MTTIQAGRREALLTGLHYAKLMQYHFPAQYTQHIAARKAKPPDLYGTAVMFLTLAHQHLIALDFGKRGEGRMFKPSEPNYGFMYVPTVEGAERALGGTLKSWLSLPLPKVYGLGRDLNKLMPRSWTTHNPDTRDTSRHALALLLWNLVSSGPWQVARPTDITDAAQWLPPRMTGITGRPALSSAVPLAQLCARLDRDQPLGITRLGSILAYVCGKVSNPYADWSSDEIRQRYDMAVDLNWRYGPDRFAVERQMQQHAKNLAAAYGRLDRRIYQNPALLEQISQDIRATAGELLRTVGDYPDRGDAYEPKSLLNILEGM